MLEERQQAKRKCVPGRLVACNREQEEVEVVLVGRQLFEDEVRHEIVTRVVAT